MPGPTFVDGERVELRTIEREDVEFLQRARTQADLRVPLTFTVPQTREQVEEFYENTVAADNGDANFLVCREGTPVGEASLFRVEGDHGEIAYWLLPEERGEGYTTEAVSLLLDYAFETRGLHHVVAKIVAFNEGSRSLVERLGFEREGRLREHHFARGAHRDVLYYGLLAEERDEFSSAEGEA